MKIAVLVKSVPDTAATPEIGVDGKTVATDRIEFVLSPYDEYAVEEALRLKGSVGAEVTAVSCGGESALKALRSAFAMGIEAGVLARPPEGIMPTGRGVALCLAAALRDLVPDMVLAGKQAVDDDGAQVAERVAEHLGFSHASAVTRVVAEGKRVVVNREIEGGHLVMDMPMPAVLTLEKGINTPRYPSLPQILKAKSRKIQEFLPAYSDFNLEPGWRVEALTLARPDRRRQVLNGEVTDCVGQMVDLLRQECLT
jgi:electron transfer flavoprotein beta subunit